MSIVIDGITLPDFPADSEYEYKAIFRVDNSSGEDSSTVFILLLSKVEFTHAPHELVGDLFGIPPTMSVVMPIAPCQEYSIGYEYEFGSPTLTWEFITDDVFFVGSFDSGDVTETYTLKWANHDIKNTIAINYETEEIIVGDEIYFPNSEAVSYEEAYSMPYTWFVNMANHARRLSGTNGKLTPQSIDSVFNSIEYLEDISEMAF